MRRASRSAAAAVALFASAAAAGSAASPSSAAGGRAATPPDAAARCPALFSADDGAPAARLEIARGENAVDIASEGRAWDAPVVVDVRGLSMVARVEEPRRAAVVDVERELAPLCRPGRYALPVGARVGEDLEVVAVLRDGVLFAHEERALVFAPFQDARAPAFRMIWRADWTLLWPPAPGPPSPAPPPPPPRKAAPPSPKKKR